VALENLAKELTQANSKVKDAATQAHLKDLSAEVNSILNPENKR
jgi:hypothetical protein